MTVNSLEQKALARQPYRHARFEARRRFLRFLIRSIGFTLLAKVDSVEGLENIPAQGPALLMINHLSFLDPFIPLYLSPRLIVPMAKIEVYEHPLGIFTRLWGVIPVRREEVDRRALQLALEVLRAGEMVLLAPEGTRSPQLKQGKEGVAYLATRTAASVVPVAMDNTEGFPALRGSARWRAPGATVRFGRPFRFRCGLERPGREMLRQMTDEALYILAGLLPEHRRGVYADLENATQDTIEWL